MLQDQLQCRKQQFEAWKLEVENKTLALQSQVSQSQVQAPVVVSSGPAISKIDLRDVEIRSVRSVSSKRSRSRDPAPTGSKRARSQTRTTIPQYPSLPKGTTQEGLLLLLSHLRPVLDVLRTGQCKLKI